MYGGYVETDPRPLLIVCSFNIAFLAALLWTLPVKKTASFIAASVGAFALLLSLAYCHANIYFFIYLLYLIMSINVIFRDETCNAMFNFFSKSEHKADLYTFISIVMVYLLFLFYFANIVASFIVCVSLVANYFIVVHKISNNFENKVASKKAELETLQERLNVCKPQFDDLGKEILDLKKDIASKKEEGTRQRAIIAENQTIIAENQFKLDEISGHRRIVDTLIREKSALERDNAKLATDKTALEEDKKRLSREKTELSSQRDTIQAQIGDEISVRKERDSLQKQVVAANDTILGLRKERDNYQAEANHALKKVDKLQAQIGDEISVRKERDSLQKQVVAANDIIVGLKAERTNYQAEANHALQKVNQLQAQVVAANDTIVGLKAERNNYRAEANHALQNVNYPLHNVNQLQAQLEAANDTIERLRDERDNYRVEANNALRKLNER